MASSISAMLMRLGAVTRRPSSSIMKPIERRVERRNSYSRMNHPPAAGGAAAGSMAAQRRDVLTGTAVSGGAT
jgi:hypothetical protein